jgi:hypothetical protein
VQVTKTVVLNRHTGELIRKETVEMTKEQYRNYLVPACRIIANALLERTKRKTKKLI